MLQNRKKNKYISRILFHFVFFTPRQDFIYHGIAAFFYLSASVALAKVTLEMNGATGSTGEQNYKLDIAAVVSQDVSS